MSSFANGSRKRANRLILLLGLTGFLVVLGFYRLQSRPVMAQAQQVQVVELKAKKYEFDPCPVHVKAGTKVQLKITAIDHDHGFKIATYPDGKESSGAPGLVFTSAQDCWLLKKGETTTIEFMAQTPGTYPFHCASNVWDFYSQSCPESVWHHSIRLPTLLRSLSHHLL